MTSVERVLQERLRELKSSLADTVASGGAKNWEEYMRLTGQIIGISQAERFLSELVDEREAND